MMQRIKKFGELSWNEQLLFSEAYFLQLMIGLLLKIIPFRWIPRLFSSPQSAVSSRHRIPITDYRIPQHSLLTSHPSHLKSHVSYLKQIQAATQRASWISPWKNKCLVQSLAARIMLKRRKMQSQLSLGVAKDTNGKMIAHSWLRVGDYEIVKKNGEYSELFLF